MTSSPDKAIVGVEFTFTCTTNVQFVSFRRETQNECLITGNYPNGTCRMSGTYNPNYTYDCNTSAGVYKLTIPSAFDIDILHGSSWTCTDVLTGDTSTPISLNVYGKSNR